MTRPKRGLVGLGALLVLASACAEEEDLGVRNDIFGSIHIEAHRTANLPATPFVDTASVTAEVIFGQCLTDFYDAHAEWAPDGSKGSFVADAWLDVLCDRAVYEDVFKCLPTSHEWKPGAGPNGRHVLQVNFDALHHELDNFDIRIGPIARENHADCEPVVELASDGVKGFDAGGANIWRIDAGFTEAAWGGPRASTVTNDNESVKIWVERAD